MRPMVTGLILLLIMAIGMSALNCDCGPKCQDEHMVVGDLVEHSQAFAAFYEADRGRMPEHICWVEDPSRPEWWPAETNTKTNTTYLKRIPPRSEDDFIIAHELCSYILEAEGFRGTQPTTYATEMGFDVISGYLNNMIGTPRRDSILGNYGFNLEEQYENYLGDFFTGPHPPADLVEEFRYLFFYAEMVLYWEDVLNKTEMSDFQQTFDDWYKDLAKDGHSLIRKIRSIGYDTPEKWATLFEDIIEDCDLYEVVGLERESGDNIP